MLTCLMTLTPQHTIWLITWSFSATLSTCFAGLSGGVIAGISTGGVVGALLLVACIIRGFYFNIISPGSTSEESDFTGTPVTPSHGLIISVYKAVEFSYEELEKATNGFSIDLKIGQGAFGAVYCAELRGEKAAIKKMDMTAKTEFRAELDVLTHAHHLNVVHLIGYGVDRFLFLVYEYIENGNLSQHLHDTEWDPVPWPTRVQIALDSARGLEYIHEYTTSVYIHRDIKSTNILIDKSFRAKIADFGLTKLAELGGSTNLSSISGYIAPECRSFQCRDISPKVDVYAFGVVLYELISAKQAITAEPKDLDSLFEEALNKPDPREDLCKLIDPRLGDNYPLESVLEMARLAQACTQVNQEHRPSMRVVVRELLTL